MLFGKPQKVRVRPSGRSGDEASTQWAVFGQQTACHDLRGQRKTFEPEREGLLRVSELGVACPLASEVAIPRRPRRHHVKARGRDSTCKAGAGTVVTSYLQPEAPYQSER